MARIVNAQKVEVLRSLRLTEYAVDITFTRHTEGGSVEVSLTRNPVSVERAEIRTAVEGIVIDDETTPLTVITAILDELTRRDKANEHTWGDQKGEQRPYTTNVWLTEDQMKAIANVFEGDLRNAVADTIRAALNTNTGVNF